MLRGHGSVLPWRSQSWVLCLTGSLFCLVSSKEADPVGKELLRGPAGWVFVCMGHVLYQWEAPVQLPYSRTGSWALTAAEMHTGHASSLECRGPTP